MTVFKCKMQNAEYRMRPEDCNEDKETRRQGDKETRASYKLQAEF